MSFNIRETQPAKLPLQPHAEPSISTKSLEFGHAATRRSRRSHGQLRRLLRLPKNPRNFFLLFAVIFILESSRCSPNTDPSKRTKKTCAIPHTPQSFATQATATKLNRSEQERGFYLRVRIKTNKQKNNAILHFAPRTSLVIHTVGGSHRSSNFAKFYALGHAHAYASNRTVFRMCACHRRRRRRRFAIRKAWLAVAVRWFANFFFRSPTAFRVVRDSNSGASTRNCVNGCVVAACDGIIGVSRLCFGRDFFFDGCAYRFFFFVCFNPVFYTRTFAFVCVKHANRAFGSRVWHSDLVFRFHDERFFFLCSVSELCDRVRAECV